MNKEIQALIVILLGAVTLRLSATDEFLSYVREPMRPLLLLSGVLLLALGAWSLWRATVRDSVPAGGGTGTTDADHHHHGLVAWLLVLPILAIFLIAPPPLGVDAAARDSGVIAVTSGSWPPLPDADPAEVDLDEFAARTYDDAGRQTLEGNRVLLLGFSSPAPGEGWYLTRFVSSCCAADAAAVKVLVVGQPNPGDGQWAEVVGTHAPESGGEFDDSGAAIPTLIAESVTVVGEPRVPYL